MRFRLLRRRLTVSAPRMAVRSALPWPLRWFLLALMLSDAFSLNGIYFLLSHILSLGALALIVLFQPEIRRLIDQLGSSRWRSFNPFARTPSA